MPRLITNAQTSPCIRTVRTAPLAGTIAKHATCKVKVVSVDLQAGLNIAWSKILKTSFLASLCADLYPAVNKMKKKQHDQRY